VTPEVEEFIREHLMLDSDGYLVWRKVPAPGSSDRRGWGNYRQQGERTKRSITPPHDVSGREFEAREAIWLLGYGEPARGAIRYRNDASREDRLQNLYLIDQRDDALAPERQQREPGPSVLARLRAVLIELNRFGSGITPEMIPERRREWEARFGHHGDRDEHRPLQALDAFGGADP
jgi:hypothetical protein